MYLCQVELNRVLLFLTMALHGPIGTGGESLWPSGKGARLVSGRTSVRFPAWALLSLQKLWFTDSDFRF